MSILKVDEIVDASGGSNAVLYGPASPAGSMGFRNRIINGDMRIDQRNAGASVTPVNGQYTVDRWSSFLSQSSKYTVQQNAGSVTAPAGFSNYLGVTSSSAYSVVSGDYFFQRQYIEGFNFADAAWGTADAKTITISFWVRSSLTGTFGGAVGNSASNRSYPFTYTISSANTWEQKSVTIAGDTSGTWIGSTNGVGLRVDFAYGVGSTYSGTANAWASGNYVSATGATSVVGTNGATWYITGVQLEVGSVATEFERRPYGTELALCQRYFYMAADGASKTLGLGTMYTSTEMQGAIFFPVTMRATPTLSAVSGTNYYEFIRNGAADPFNSLSLGNRTSTTIGEILNNTEVSGTVGHSGYIRTDNAAVKVGFSAEL